jgi:hypothetical protein
MHSGGPLFTFQCWVYPTSMPGSGEERAIFTTIDGTANVGISLRLAPNNSTSSYFSCYIARGSAGTYIFSSASSGTVPLNAWSHIALVYDQSLASNNGIFYINGVQSGTGNKTGSSVASSDASYSGRIGAYQVSESITYNFRGFISDLKISNTADSIVLPTKPLLPDSNTKLLTLQTRAPSQNINFIDSSPNEFLVTRSGNTTQGTFSPFSPTGWSGYFSGSNSLSVASNAAFAIGTGDFSFECWIYFSGTARGGGVSGELFGSTTTGAIVLRYLSGTLAVSRAGTADDMSASVTLTSGQWYHICVARTGTTGGLYLNGNRVAVNNSYTASYAQGDMQCISGTNGYFSNCRLIKGSNPYGTGSTINVPTAPLTAISGTSLLICQSNRFVDNGPNSFTITLANSPSIQAFSPFAPQNAVSPLVTGGSAYFDGTGDYLSITTTSADFNLTGDFTIEFYANPDTQTNSYPSILACASAWSAGAFYVRYSDTQTANKFAVFLNPSDPLITASITSAVGSWHHVAVTRSGSNIILWVNGLNVGNATNSTTINLALGGGVWIGNNGSTSCFYKGYTSNLRVIKGIALYTANFTPPTAPLTAVPNTSLLLNFTNGAAVDATGRAVFESVGGVFSTRAQAKFDPLIGGSSIYFNGTANTRLQTSSSSSPTLLNMGTGDYTVECWIRPVGTPASQQCIWDFRATDVSGQGVALNWTPSRTIFLYYLATRITSSPITTDTWHHTAVVRANGVYSLYIDGALVGTYNNSDTVAPAANRPYLGAVGDGSQVYNGYIDNFRMTRYARYLTGTGANANQMVFNGTNVLALPTAPFPRG